MKIEKVDPFDYPLWTKEEIMKDLEVRPNLDHGLEVQYVDKGDEYETKKESRTISVYLDINKLEQ